MRTLRLWEVRDYGAWAPQIHECITLLRLAGWPMVRSAPRELQPPEIAHAYMTGEVARLCIEAAMVLGEGVAINGSMQRRPSREDLATLMQSEIPEVRLLGLRLAGRQG